MFLKVDEQIEITYVYSILTVIFKNICILWRQKGFHTYKCFVSQCEGDEKGLAKNLRFSEFQNLNLLIMFLNDGLIDI